MEERQKFMVLHLLILLSENVATSRIASLVVVWLKLLKIIVL